MTSRRDSATPPPNEIQSFGMWIISFVIAEITFVDLGNGKTRYRTVARHWNEETLKQHREMSVGLGWTQTSRQLEAQAKKI